MTTLRQGLAHPPLFTDFEAAFQAHNDMLLVVDGTGQILAANRASEAISGYPPEALSGRNVALLLPADTEEHRQHVLDYFRAPTTRKMSNRAVLQLRRSDNQYQAVEISLSPLRSSAGDGALVTIRDATRRQDRDHELTLRAHALEAAAHGVVMTDKRGSIIWVNSALCQISGYQREELLGQTPRVFRSGRHNKAFYQELWQTLLAGQSWSGEFVNRRKDGSLYYEHQHIAPVKDHRGQVAHFISIKQDITAQKHANQELKIAYRELKNQLSEIRSLKDQLQQQAYRDPLTNLYNRRYLAELLPKELQRAGSQRSPVSLLAIDIDHFKETNDNLGHSAGDQILVLLGELMKASCRASDLCCRLGGDEFWLVMFGTGPMQAKARAEALKESFRARQPKFSLPKQTFCTLSIGVVQWQGESTQALYERADSALYQAKSLGKNRVHLDT